MRPTKIFSAGLTVLLLALAGCDSEVVSDEPNDEGKAEVAGSEDEGAGGEAAEDEDDDGEDASGGGGGGPVVVESCDPEAVPANLECCPGMIDHCFDDPGEIEEFGDWLIECDEYGVWPAEECMTPLVFSYDGREPSMAAADASMAFDLVGDTEGIITDWPRAETPWLAFDRDGDGRIADGRELFGSATVLASGARAKHGFEALAELDADHNGVVDAADPGFASLTRWSDVDGDRASDVRELSSMDGGARRIVSIDLGYRVEARCDARGNCGVERAAFRWEDERGMHDGEVVDVHLRRR